MKERPDQIVIFSCHPVPRAQRFSYQFAVLIDKKMRRMGSDTIVFYNFSVSIQRHGEGQFMLIYVFFYSFFALSIIYSNDNKPLIIKFIV